MRDDPANHQGDSYGRDDPTGCLEGAVWMVTITLLTIAGIAAIKWIASILFIHGWHF